MLSEDVKDGRGKREQDVWGTALQQSRHATSALMRRHQGTSVLREAAGVFKCKGYRKSVVMAIRVKPRSSNLPSSNMDR